MVSLRERLASDRSRVLAGDQPFRAPQQEAAADGQVRFWRGRAEAHGSLADISGGDSTRTWRSSQIGGSSQIGATAWFSGWRVSWDRPGVSAAPVRRVESYIGHAGASASPLLFRLLQSSTVGSAASWEVSGQWSRGLGAGARLILGPEAVWRERALDRAGLGLGASRALPWPGARVSARLRVDVNRDRRFRPAVSEATLAVSLRPRPRDRWDVELRRGQGDGSSGYEMTTSYDLQRPRFAGDAAEGRRRSQADVTVRVLRGDGGGVEGVLVSLDGRDLRFTDSAGEAVFESVSPGMHEIAVEERTLPGACRVLGATRRLIAVERGEAPTPLRFEIGRPERRSKF